MTEACDPKAKHINPEAGLARTVSALVDAVNSLQDEVAELRRTKVDVGSGTTTSATLELEEMRKDVESTKAVVVGVMPSVTAFAELREQVAAATACALSAPPAAAFLDLFTKVGELRSSIQSMPSASAFAQLKDIVQASVPRLTEQFVGKTTLEKEFVECASWNFVPPMGNLRLVVEAAVHGQVWRASDENGVNNVGMGLKLTAGNEGVRPSETQQGYVGKGVAMQVVPLTVSHMVRGCEEIRVCLWHRAQYVGDSARIGRVQLKTSWHPAGE